MAAAGGSHRKYVPWTQHTRGTSPGVRCCAIIFSPFISRSWTRQGRGTLFGSTPAPYRAYQAPSDSPDGAVTAWVCKTTGAGQTLGPFLVSRHSLCRGWPTAGRQRVFSWVASLRVVKSHLGSPDVVCHCGGSGDRGSLSRLSPPVPGRHGGRGHTCRSPSWACSVSNAAFTIRRVPGWHVRCVPRASHSDATRRRVW